MYALVAWVCTDPLLYWNALPWSTCYQLQGVSSLGLVVHARLSFICGECWSVVMATSKFTHFHCACDFIASANHLCMQVHVHLCWGSLVWITKTCMWNRGLFHKLGEAMVVEMMAHCCAIGQGSSHTDLSCGLWEHTIVAQSVFGVAFAAFYLNASRGQNSLSGGKIRLSGGWGQPPP